MRTLRRNSTTITIATFWENHQLNKYNYDPLFQRSGEVWSIDKQSLLIDTILRNFPMPPIFLRQHIDSVSGKTMYDVIDGKQRLSSIISFIKGKNKTPESIDLELQGDTPITGLSFDELDSAESELRKRFWKYEISIELIDSEDEDIINFVFDRLNRNGEPLTPQELRKAKFGAKKIYRDLNSILEQSCFKYHFSRIDVNRYENVEFISELLFSLEKRSILSGDRVKVIDGYYEEYSELGFTDDTLKLFNDVCEELSLLGIPYEDYKLGSLSHIYALFFICTIFNLRNISIQDHKDRILQFYQMYSSNPNENDNTQDYKVTVSAGTKGVGRRITRINSILKHLGIAPLENANIV